MQAVPWCSGQSCELLGLATEVRILPGLWLLAFESFSVAWLIER